MKKAALMLGAVLTLAFTLAVAAQEQSTKDGECHLGTWELVATKYGDAEEFTDYPKERRRLKMITATHFNWLDYEMKTRKVATSAGGTYSLEDDVYIETIEFAGEGMEPYLDKKQEFTIKIDGDKVFQSGQLSSGLKIEEKWRRLE